MLCAAGMLGWECAARPNMSEDRSPTPFVRTLNATDIDTAAGALTWSINTPALHGTASASGSGFSKAIGYTPDVDYTGADSFVVQVSDGSTFDVITVNVNIAGENDAPVIAEGASIGVVMSEDDSPTAFSLTLNATDAEGSALTWSINSNAGNGFAAASGTGASKVISYTPLSNFNGMDSFVVQVSDGVLSDTITVNVTINPENDSPVITEGASANVVMSEDATPTDFALTLNATDIDSGTLTWSISSTAANGTASASGSGASKTIGYVPNADFNGMDSFVVQVSDGSATDTLTVSVTVSSEDDAPTIDEGASVNVAMSEDGAPTPFSLLLNATDVDTAAGGLTWSIQTQANNGSASASGTGTSKAISYVADAHYVGMDSFVVQVSDGAGAATIVVDVTLAAVNDAPIFSSTPPTSATETELYTYNVGVTDPDDSGLNSNIFITLNTAPAGMVLDPNSGVITWTPPVAGATPVDVEIQVEDGNEDSSAPQLQNWQISVDDVNDPPLITSTAPTTATEDTVYTYAVAVTDPDDANNGANLTWQLTNAPSGMTVSSTGVITWTPLEGVLTSGAVTVQVADGGESGASPDTENFTVSVTPVNDEPVITAVPSANAVESTLYSFTVTVSDPDDSNWNFSLSNAPAGMTIGATTGVINWTPAEGVSTSGTVTVSAADDGADGAMPGSQAFSIGVTAVNDAPQITSTALTSATEGVLYQYQLAVLDSDDANNGTDLSFVLNSAPAGMSVSSTGLIQWTPANGVASANVQVQVADGGENSAAPAVQSFTISVTAVNNPVQIDSAPVTTATEATLYSYQLAVTDLDDANNGTDLNFALLTAPAGMTVSSTGLIEWTPPEGTVSENVDVQVADGLEDGAVAASQAFSIAVTAVNNAPQITSTAPATGTEDIQYSYQLLVNDPDDANDGIALTYSLTNAPTGMAISPSGLITWTPTEGVSSSGSVTVDVQDGGEDGALPDSEIFSVAVTAVNDAPVITAVPTLSAVEDTLYNFSVTVSDDDDSSWTFALVNAPTGMSIDGNGLISWTPLDGVLTSGSVTVTAADGGEDGVAAAVQNFTIGVIPVNDAPTITAVPTINAVEDTLYAFNVLVSDPDDSSWSFSLNNQPAGMTIDANGLISWTADEGVSSSGTVTVNVADGGEDGATPDSQTFAIGVTPVNDAPVITALPSANATEDVAYTFTVTVSDPDDTSWTFSLSGAPIGMSIDANGEISWTPVEGDTTSGSVTVMVADGGEDSAAPDSQAFTIGVTAVNDAPQISSAAPLSVSEDVLYQYPLTVIDPDDSNNGELTFTLITAPVGMTISSTGLIQWTATEQGPLQLLPYDVDVEVEVRDGEEDGAAPDTQAFTLSVSPVNDAPLLTQVGGQTVEEQSAFDLTLVATDSDDNNNGTDLIWSLQSAPAAMSISTDGVMSWTPGQGTAGDYTITVEVADGEEDGAQPAQMTFVLTVTQLDGDGDGVADYDDNCPLESNADQANNDSDSDGDLCDPDDDNDGMTDVAELANGLDPFDSSDATADADNDGVTNLDEFLLCQGVGDVVCNAISQDSIAPLISHTPVRVNSNGFLTPVLLEANAVDTNDGNVAVEVVTINGKLLGPNNKVEAGQEYAFRTGRNEVIWRAQDRAGNVTDDNDVNNTQSIEVVPQVLLGGSQVRGENQVAALTVYLNGPALSYPVTVYYNFSGSADAADVGMVPMQVDITAGESATFNLPILDDGIVEGDETLTVTLVGVSGEAILGEQTSHDVLVVERQVAPEVSIAVTQNGRLGHRVYTDVSEGVVSLTATTHDANNDPLTFSWASENAAIDVSACVTALCTFDPQMLNDGVYRFTLAVSDGSDQTLQSSYVQVMNGTLTVLDAADDQDGDGVDDATEGHDDADADGLADYLDVPVPPFVQQIAVGEGGVELNQALQTSAGLTIALGADAGAAAQAGVRVASNQLPRDTDYAELGGIYDFEIHGLNDGQRVATVVIPLQQPITPDAVYRMLAADLHVTREWLTFVSGSDAVSSTSRVGGVCPDANSAQWRAGLQPGANCMRLTLRDGGVNDGDREANGVIRVTAGVALAREQYSDNSAPTEGPNKGGGSVGVLWLLAACLVSLRRKRMGSGAGLSAKIERNGCTVNE
jgi:VCBS repeat-containing protein